ncbi:MAG: hypothetical protein ABI119_03360 [Gemmatimonadaceae bacterium]
MMWAALALTVILFAALLKLHRVEEWHHGYYGAMLCLLSFGLRWPWWVMAVGLVLLLDDDVQHVAEASGLVPRMADFTPIHRLGAWLLSFHKR